MAKTKTLTKKTTNNSSKPAVAENEVSLTMTSDEVFSVVQILSFSKDIFHQMSLNCTKEGDEETSLVYAARSRLSLMLYTKFKALANIGEPTSREVH
jgi:hypothetical protein